MVSILGQWLNLIWPSESQYVKISRCKVHQNRSVISHLSKHRSKWQSSWAWGNIRSKSIYQDVWKPLNPKFYKNQSIVYQSSKGRMFDSQFCAHIESYIISNIAMFFKNLKNLWKPIFVKFGFLLANWGEVNCYFTIWCPKMKTAGTQVLGESDNKFVESEIRSKYWLYWIGYRIWFCHVYWWPQIHLQAKNHKILIISSQSSII